MARQRLMIAVQGNTQRWMMFIHGDPKHFEEWRADGLQVAVVENTIPEWVAFFGLTRPWCFLQDLLTFRNPFRK